MVNKQVTEYAGLVFGLGLSLMGALAAGSAHAQARVQEPWSRATAAGQAVAGGYLKIEGGAAGDRLLSATSEVARAVELHTMQMDGDVMRMRQVAVIEVPAGQAVELKPGGLHLMLMGLKAPLKAGEAFPLTLRFEKAGEMRVEVQVRPAMQPVMKHDGHNHGGHNHSGHKH